MKTKLATLTVCAAMTSAVSHASILIQDWNGAGESGFGSLAMDPNDDRSSTAIIFDDFSGLAFDSGVNFFGTTYDSFFINNNGNVSFNGAIARYTPTAFPASEQPMIAPFWADVDTSCDTCGNVYIGSPNSETMVVTWDQVGYFPSNSSLTNTFQLVLIDRSDTGAGNFDVEFRYEDINWTTGDFSDGEGGLGGIAAQAGYDAGDGVNFFTVPGSRTDDIVNIDTNPSNTETAGIWAFAIRNGELPGSSAENPIMPIVNLETPTDYEFEFSILDIEVPIFIDPDVAVGYDYIVNSGPNIASVVLPTGFDDNLFDLYLWDESTNDWYDSLVDITGGIEYFFDQPVSEFRVVGIDISEMLDPTDSTAFVTGLTFESSGLVNMNQNAVTTYVDDGTTSSVPVPGSVFLMLTGLVVVLRRKRVNA